MFSKGWNGLRFCVVSAINTPLEMEIGIGVLVWWKLTTHVCPAGCTKESVTTYSLSIPHTAYDCQMKAVSRLRILCAVTYSARGVRKLRALRKWSDSTFENKGSRAGMGRIVGKTQRFGPIKYEALRSCRAFVYWCWCSAVC